MEKFDYKIIKKLGVLSQTVDGHYTKEVNIISFKDKDPVIDIRRWDREQDRMFKGISINKKETEALIKILSTLKEREV